MCIYCAIKGFTQTVEPNSALSIIDPNEVRGSTGFNGKPSLTVDEAAAQLTRSGLTLNGYGVTGLATTVTFAFRESAATMPSDTGDFSQFNEAQITATLYALASWSDVANINFVRVGSGTAGAQAYSNNATMLFGNYSTGADGAAAFAYYPFSRAVDNEDSDVWVNVTSDYNANPVFGDYGPQVLVHEIGHALGLSHPSDYDASSGSPTYETDASYYEDSRQYSIMSYFGGRNTTAAFLAFSAVPMLDDIAAVQRLYGANMTTRTGDTVYGFNSNADQPWFIAHDTVNSDLTFCVWDAGGLDSFDFSLYTTESLIDLREGHFSSMANNVGNVSIAMGAVIENAIAGAGNDNLIGNAVANSLVGGLGNDTLNGGLGADVLDGGNGFDVTSYGFAASGVTVFLGAPQLNTGEAAGDSLLNIEGIIGSSFGDILWGTRYANSVDGGAGNDWLYGQDGADTILGGDGSDVISGGLGADSLDGGAGKDVAFYRDATSSVYNAATNGVKADMVDGHTYGISLDVANVANGFGEANGDTLSNIENIWGSNFDDIIRGSDSVGGQVYGFWGDDLLDGRGGNDVFYGGVGSDTIITGAGADDIYYKSYHDQRNAFGTLEPFEGGDTITDFEHGVDHVTVSRYWFGFGNIVGVAQSLTSQYADFITSGTTAISTKPTFFYDQATGQLMFDPDGTGKDAAVLMVTFSNNVNLTLSDIWTA